MNKLLIILLLISPVMNMSGMDIDVDMAVKLVKENNIEIKRSALELAGKKRDVDTAFNNFYPTLDGKIAFARTNTQPEVQGVALEGFENNIKMDYSVNFVFTPALFDAIKIVKKSYELGEINYNMAVKSLKKDVKLLFYNLILIRENISLLEDNLKTIQARYEITKNNFKAGLVSELDLLQVQVSLENFKPEIKNLYKVYNSSLLNFKFLMGLDLNEEIVLVGEIEPELKEISFDDAYKQAMANSNSLKLINMSGQLLTAQKKAEFSQNFLPVVGLGFSQGTGLSNIFEADMWKKENFSDDEGMFSIFISYNFSNLIPGSKAWVGQEKLDREITDLTYQRDATVEGIKLQLINHLETLNTSLSIQKGLELTVELASKNLISVEEAYRAGTVQLLDVENSENEYKKARLELLREKFNYLNAWLELDSIISK